MWLRAPQAFLCEMASENTSSHLRMQENVWALQKGRHRTKTSIEQKERPSFMSLSQFHFEA